MHICVSVREREREGGFLGVGFCRVCGNTKRAALDRLAKTRGRQSAWVAEFPKAWICCSSKGGLTLDDPFDLSRFVTHCFLHQQARSLKTTKVQIPRNFCGCCLEIDDNSLFKMSRPSNIARTVENLSNHVSPQKYLRSTNRVSVVKLPKFEVKIGGNTQTKCPWLCFSHRSFGQFSAGDLHPCLRKGNKIVKTRAADHRSTTSTRSPRLWTFKATKGLSRRSSAADAPVFGTIRVAEP